MTDRNAEKTPVRWHIAIFLLPAVIVYSVVMILPLFGTLQLSLYNRVDSNLVFVGLANFKTLFGDALWADQFWNALRNNIWLFVIHMCVQNPNRHYAGSPAQQPGSSLSRILSKRNLRSHIAVICDCRFRLETDFVATLGCRPFAAGYHRPKEPVFTVAG